MSTTKTTRSIVQSGLGCPKTPKKKLLVCKRLYAWFIQVNHFYMHNVQVTTCISYNLAYTNLFVLCTPIFANVKNVSFFLQIKGFSYFLNFLKKFVSNFVTSSNSWIECGYG